MDEPFFRTPKAERIPLVDENILWRTVSMGLFRSVRDYHAAFERFRMRLDPPANRLINTIHVLPYPLTVNCVKTTPHELGFSEPVSFPELVTRAEGRGLSRFAPEVSIMLRLSYTDQPMGEKVITACSAMRDPASEHEYVFALAKLSTNELVLRAEPTDVMVTPDALVAFQRIEGAIPPPVRLLRPRGA